MGVVIIRSFDYYWRNPETRRGAIHRALYKKRRDTPRRSRGTCGVCRAEGWWWRLDGWNLR